MHLRFFTACVFSASLRAAVLIWLACFSQALLAQVSDGEGLTPLEGVVAISDDRALWDSVKDSRDVNELRVYLKQFPNGLFAALANVRIRALEQAASEQVLRPPLATPLPAPAPPPPVASALTAGQITKDIPDMVKVLFEGREFAAELLEKRDFELAMILIRKSDFASAQKAFFDFLTRYPKSGYAPSGFFWLGNAQYLTRDYKEAILNLRQMISAAPDHLRAPEAALSIANCQAELKDTRGARKTLDDLIRAYPASEAAGAAKDRRDAQSDNQIEALRLEQIRRMAKLGTPAPVPSVPAMIPSSGSDLKAPDARPAEPEKSLPVPDTVRVLFEGQEFAAELFEKRDFELAMILIRKSDFASAQKAFFDFLTRYPKSGYAPSGLFWLGNAQYQTRDYKEAILNFRQMISTAPYHLRAPEALLSVANCQAELKDTRGARKTLDDLIKAYPASEAAGAAKDRLKVLK